MRQLQKVFAKLDRGKTGILSSKELVGYLEADELQMLLKKDKEVLTYSEFLAAAADHSALISQENMRIIFQIVDV